MFDTKDFLFIILAFCVLWFTGFACWFIFQIAMVIKNINAILHEVKFQFVVPVGLRGLKNEGVLNVLVDGADTPVKIASMDAGEFKFDEKAMRALQDKGVTGNVVSAALTAIANEMKSN